MRGLGYILGGIIKLKIFKNTSLHRGMMISCIGASIGLFLLGSTLNKIFLALFALELSISLLLLDVFMNVCFITVGKDNVKKYINMGFLFNSVGNFIGPYLVSNFGL